MRLYVAIASGGSAESIPYIKSFTHDSAVARYDVTAAGDSNLSYVQGFPDAKGQYTGFWDNASVQLYTAASDGISRKTYFYPDIVNTPTVYRYGLAFWDITESFPTDGGISINGTWAADGVWTRQGAA